MKHHHKLEKITLKIFLACMFLCAALFLIAIWADIQNEAYMKATFTVFVAGLASFLTWLPIILTRLAK